MARRRGAQFHVDRTPPHSPSRLCGRQLGSHLPLTSHDGRDTGTNLWEDAMSWSEPSVPHTLRRQNEALNSHGTPSCWMMVSSLKRRRAHDRRALLPPNPKDGEEAHPSTPARVGDGRDTDEAGLARGNSKKEGGEESNQTRPWPSCFSPPANWGHPQHIHLAHLDAFPSSVAASSSEWCAPSTTLEPLASSTCNLTAVRIASCAPPMQTPDSNRP